MAASGPTTNLAEAGWARGFTVTGLMFPEAGLLPALTRGQFRRADWISPQNQRHLRLKQTSRIAVRNWRSLALPSGIEPFSTTALAPHRLATPGVCQGLSSLGQKGSRVNDARTSQEARTSFMSIEQGMGMAPTRQIAQALQQAGRLGSSSFGTLLHLHAIASGGLDMPRHRGKQIHLTFGIRQASQPGFASTWHRHYFRWWRGQLRHC